MKNIFKPKPVSVSYKNIDLTNPKEKAKLMTQLRKKNVDALDLSNSKVQLDKEILEAIIENPISELDLSSNNLGDNGAKVVAGIIQNSTELRHLDLSNNKIGSEGMGALSSAFDHNKTVTDLDLSNNDLGNEGAKKVATLLANNSTIIDINLDSNKIGTDGLLHLPSSLLNRNTTNISLASAYIPEEAVARFARALQYSDNVHSINCVDKDTKEKDSNEIEVYAQKLFDTIIKIRDSNGFDKESQKEFNKLVWECIVPHPKWKDLFKDLVTNSNKPYLFDLNTLDATGKSMQDQVYNPDLKTFLSNHKSAKESKAVQQGELPPLDEKWFNTTVGVDALSLENATAQNVTESFLTSVAGNEGVKGAYAQLNDIPNSPNLAQRMQERNLREYNLVDTLTPSLEEGAEMRTITGDHFDPLTMTILGNDDPLLTRTIVHDQDVPTTARLSSVTPKKATLEHKDNPKMQAEAKKLGKTMFPHMASPSQSNATPNTPNTGKKHGQSSGFKR
ncbi:MAG: hypothetical protein ACJBCI_00340 [Candidatus Tisiphia sp.]|uniref:hypothetical protein n=1 Tax=Candidatus Tisiphia endosymbiont of Melanophora roralis TaxID=3066261 RepID=UPI001E6A5536|nr:MAG: hypothetical protein LF884_03110 [Rickettsia endosymbiont of Cimex lectularius]